VTVSDTLSGVALVTCGGRGIGASTAQELAAGTRVAVSGRTGAEVATTSTAIDGLTLVGDDAPCTPPELAPRLVRILASGRADALAGRYLHAEQHDVEQLIRRADEIEPDLNAIWPRLRR
jgi:NAD(P)-dependent dehydrogenase (short-subunit alcohol dehydrogenase family)